MVEKRNLLFFLFFSLHAHTEQTEPGLPSCPAPERPCHRVARHGTAAEALVSSVIQTPDRRKKKTHKPSTRQSLNILPKEAVCKSFIGTLIMVMLGWIRHAAKKAFCNNFPLQNRAITPGPWKETKNKTKTTETAQTNISQRTAGSCSC